MIAFFLLLILLSAVFVIWEMSTRVWLAVAALAMLLGAVTGLTNGVLSLLTALVMGAVLVLLYFTPGIRRRWVSRPLRDWVETLVPQLSPVEREAMDAGTAGWESGLFDGRPDWGRLMDIPAPRLDRAEREFIEGPVEELCAMSVDRGIMHRPNDLPPEVWLHIRDRTFLGLGTPAEYGGLGFAPLARSCILQKLATRSSAATVTVMTPYLPGPADLLHRHGTEAQKSEYLPRLARGEEIPVFCLAGTAPDVEGMTGVGIVCRGKYNGADVLGFRVNWMCQHIALGPVATLIGLAFRTHDPEGYLGEPRDLGITCVVIPADTEGVTMGSRRRMPGTPFQCASNSGRDVFVPMERVIGGPERVGHGQRMLLESLGTGDHVCLPAVAGGIAKIAARASGAHALIREQFRHGAGQVTGSTEALAGIGGLTYLLDSGRIMMAASLGLGERPAVLSAIVSRQCAGLLREVIDHVMSLHGGRAVSMGPGNVLPLARHLDSVGAAMEGDGDLTGGLTLFGRAAIRGHPCLQEEVRAVGNPDREAGLAAFDEAFCRHLAHSLENKMRTIVYGLSRGRLARGTGDGLVRRYSRQLEYLSAAFAWVADLALVVLWGDLKRHELLSGRYSDALGNLFLAAAAIRRFRDNGEEEEEAPLMEWACRVALFRVQQALDGILGNFPVRHLGPVLRVAVFPTGRYFRLPDDRLNEQVAGILRTPGPVRDRLTEDVYLPDDPGDPMRRLEVALELCVESAGLRKRLRESGLGPRADRPWQQWLDGRVEAGDVSAAEADLLRRTRDAVSEVFVGESYPENPAAGRDGSGNGGEGKGANTSQQGKKGKRQESGNPGDDGHHGS